LNIVIKYYSREVLKSIKCIACDIFKAVTTEETFATRKRHGINGNVTTMRIKTRCPSWLKFKLLTDLMFKLVHSSPLPLSLLVLPVLRNMGMG